MTRVHPMALLRAVAANAERHPCPAHHQLAYRIRGRRGLAPGDEWFLSAVLRLTSLSPSQWERLRQVEAKAQ